ncbi:MAG TPA: hypothetical protein VMJ35_04830 [Dongiaceae bacterium]|nr:hypothetical protein [Dongiaceae bacterium]
MPGLSRNITVTLLLTFLLGLCSLFAAISDAQEPPPEATPDARDVEAAPPTPVPYPARIADGQRHGLPLEVLAVAPGTKFLVRLEDDMSTKDLHRSQTFRVRTLEPLEASQGFYLPAGALIVGHVSRVEPAGTTGRAKLCLTFDDVATRFGKLPIVAEVTAIPGDHSVKAAQIQEGVIEGRSGNQKDAAQAAAAGAAKGAVKGVKDHNKKEAAEGAALGALEAYLMEAGRGEELNLPRGCKLELELERSLYLVKE